MNQKTIHFVCWAKRCLFLWAFATVCSSQMGLAGQKGSNFENNDNARVEESDELFENLKAKLQVTEFAPNLTPKEGFKGATCYSLAKVCKCIPEIKEIGEMCKDNIETFIREELWKNGLLIPYNPQEDGCVTGYGIEKFIQLLSEYNQDGASDVYMKFQINGGMEQDGFPAKYIFPHKALIVELLSRMPHQPILIDASGCPQDILGAIMEMASEKPFKDHLFVMNLEAGVYDNDKKLDLVEFFTRALPEDEIDGVPPKKLPKAFQEALRDRLKDCALKGYEFVLDLHNKSREIKYKIIDAFSKYADALEDLKDVFNLTELDLSGCHERTDVGFKNILTKLPNLEKLDLTWCKKLTDEGFESLSGLSNLRELKLSACHGITDEGFKNVLPKFPNLEKLDFGGCSNLTDEGCKHILPKLPNLKKLSLSGCNKLTDAGLESLSGLPNLKKLYLDRCDKLTDAGFKSVLPKLPKLEKLDLTCCRNLTDAGLEGLIKGLPNLRELKLAACYELTDEGFKHILPKFPKLEKLDLGLCRNLTDAGLEGLIKGLPNLRELNLDCCKNLTDAGFKNVLPKLSKLEKLDFYSCSNLTDEGLKGLKGLPNLRELNLCWCENLTDAGFKNVLPKLPKLEKLDLGCCKNLTDSGLESLSSLSNLRELDLGWCENLTDAGFKNVLPKLPKLEKLELRHCKNLTDEGLKSLKGLSNLRELELTACHKITDEGWKSVWSKLPKLKKLRLPYISISTQSWAEKHWWTYDGEGIFIRNK